MKNKFLGEGLKNIIKQWVSHSLLLKQFLLLLYKLSGRRPWSFGYSVYKYNFIKGIIEKHLHIFKEKKLHLNYGFRMDERVVEYSWVFSRLKDNEVTILDAGSSLNHAEILAWGCLRNRKLYISTLFHEEFHNLNNVPSYI